MCELQRLCHPSTSTHKGSLIQIIVYLLDVSQTHEQRVNLRPVNEFPEKCQAQDVCQTIHGALNLYDRNPIEHDHLPVCMSNVNLFCHHELDCATGVVVG